MKKLFLDDIRNPKDGIGLVPSNLNQFYWANDWSVVRTYDEFVSYITQNGLPNFISFDHDLADEHYVAYMELQKGKIEESVPTEKTGYQAAKWLVDYCVDNSLSIPEYIVHSQNEVGKKNIQSYLENAKKHLF
jgi:hypothetical protein